MSQRGTRSFSLSAVDLDTFKITGMMVKTSDPFSSEVFNRSLKTIFEGIPKKDIPSNLYYIGHLQSPTSVTFRFHPAEQLNPKSQKNYYLWHNGQMDSLEMSKGKDSEGNFPWDTAELLDSITQKGYSGLNDFQGSFACLFLKEGEGLYAFRNAIAPLWTDESNFCSVKWDGEDVHPITKNTIISIKPEGPLIKIADFNNEYNPYGV